MPPTRTIPTAESLTVEFKSDRGPLSDHDLVLAVVCLANAQGGSLYVGVEDDGRITGVQQKHDSPAGLAALVFNMTAPAQSVRVSMLDEPGGRVAQVEVPRSDRIVSSARGTVQRRRLRADGKPECAPFLAHEFASRSSDLGLLDFSALPVTGAAIADFDPLQIARLRSAVERYRGDKALLDLSDVELQGALGLVADGGPTVAGLLLLGREAALRIHLPTHEVAFQVIADDLSVRVNTFYRLPLLEVFERVEEQFLARLNEHELQVGMFRIPVPDVDQRSFREALVNALTHRDYARLGAIHVQWTPQALSISNPGGFVDGVTFENLLVTRPRPRNLTLADAFKRIGLSERTGRGVDVIYAGMLRFGRPPPSYRGSDATSVVVELPCVEADLDFLRMVIEEERRRGTPLPLDALIVLSKVLREPHSDVAALAGAMQKDATSAKATAERLVEAGLLTGHAGRHRSYTLSPGVYGALGRKAESVRQTGFTPVQHAEMVRTWVRQHGPIRRADVVELCRVSPDQAKRLLRSLVEAGVLVRSGERKGTTYGGGPNI